MKKRFLFLIASLLFCFSAFPRGGILNGSKEVKWVQTQYFDIIYAVECSESAEVLFKNADSIYEEIMMDYNAAAYYHIPVVISNQNQMHNAYYTPSFYNRIVLYDALSSSELGVFSESILSTFKHELTHFVSLNHTGPFMRSFKEVFGDIINIGMLLSFNSFFDESATVSQESKHGEGRLNDGFFWHRVRQAKVMRNFPNIGDVTGAGSKTVSRSNAYYFGGPFALYLQETYGMEKYAQMFYLGSYGLWLKDSCKFVYNKNLRVLWREFRDSLIVPEVNANPLDVEGITDFYNHSKVFSNKNSVGSFTASVTNSKIGFAYIEDTSNDVFFIPLENGMYQKPRKLFNYRGIQKISFSNDGRFLVVDTLDLSKSNYKVKVELYDIQNKRFYKVGDLGCRESSVVFDGKDYFVVTQKSDSQYGTLITYKVVMENNKVKDFQKVCRFDLPRESSVMYSCDAENGNFAYIYNNRGQYSIRISSVCNLNQYSEYVLPLGRHVLRYINCNYTTENLELTFSYATRDTFPRLGILKVKGDLCELKLQNNDVSGGIYHPFINENKCIYAGYFVDDYKLLEYEISDISFETYSMRNSLINDNFVRKEYVPSAEFEAGSKKYNRLYWNDGVLMLDYNTEESEMTNKINPYLILVNTSGKVGFYNEKAFMSTVNFTTGTPWGSDKITVTAGGDPFSKYYGGAVTLSGENETGTFAYSLKNDFAFNSITFISDETVGEVEYTYAFGKHSSISLSDSLSFINMGGIYFEDDPRYAYSLTDFDYNFKTPCDAWLLENTSTVQYSSIHKSGIGNYDKSGFVLAAAYQYSAYKILNTKDNGNNIIAFGGVYLGKLLPLECSPNFTYNFPTKATCQLIGSKFLYDFNVETLLFSCEINRGSSTLLIPVYWDNIRIFGSYNYSVYNKTGDWEIANLCQNGFNSYDLSKVNQSVTLTIMTNLTLNTGGFANRGSSLGIYYFYTYYFDYYDGSASRKNGYNYGFWFSIGL